MYCSKCRELFGFVYPRQDKEFNHYSNGEELRESSENGCPLCKIILHACVEKLPKPTNYSSSLAIRTIQNRALQISCKDPTINSKGEEQFKKLFVAYVIFELFQLPTVYRSALHALEYSKESNTGSDKSFALCSAWLKECLKSHTNCLTSAAGSTTLPHRVIDVGPSDGSSEPYLLETSGQTGEYFTLSHCWGGGTPIMTTLENLQQHRAKIEQDKLPMTFRNAIEVTRKLGLRYLWVDSLCIIQNSPKDWETEAALMHQYYKQSMLTIAAAGAANSEAGLFGQRSEPSYCSFELPATSLDDGARQAYAFTNDQSFELKRSSLSNSYKPSQLYTRAWVFQEQVLSVRTLIYFRDHIAWRCQEELCSERTPFAKPISTFIAEDKNTDLIRRHGDPRTTDATVAELQRKWIFPRTLPGSSRTNENVGYHRADCIPQGDEFLIAWGEIVQSYTDRKMTYQKDKLIALQGIANALIPIVSGKYHAGIWIQSNRSIFMGLLWSSSILNSNSKRLNVAPSWSWASTTSRIIWPGHWLCQIEPRITILKLSLPTPGTKSSPQLIIEGNCRLGMGKDGQEFDIVDWPHSLTTQGSSLLEHDLLDSTWPLDRLKTAIGLDEHLKTNQLLWFVETAAGHQHLDKREEVHCLVLVKCEGSSDFRRVGYGIWRKADWIDDNFPRVKKMAFGIL